VQHTGRLSHQSTAAWNWTLSVNNDETSSSLSLDNQHSDI